MARSPTGGRFAARSRVEDYLRRQKRFAHLFAGTADRRDRPTAGDGRSQHPPLRPARQGRAVMRKAICRHPRCRIQPGQPDRFLAQRATGVRRPPPAPATRPCPAGENIQQWLFHAEEGHYEAAWRVLTRDNPLAAIMGRVCYHLRGRACNRGQLDRIGRHQCGGALPRRRGARGVVL